MNYKYILVMFIAVTGQCFAMKKGKEGYPGGCLRNSQENTHISQQLSMFATIERARHEEKGDERFVNYFFGSYLAELGRKQTQQDREQNGEDAA